MSLNNITTELREKSFFYSLLLFVIVLPSSVAFISIASAILFLQAIVLFPWSNVKQLFKSNKTLFYIPAIFGVYLLGMLYTSNLSLAFYELKKVAFWIVIPMGLVLSPKLSERRFYNVLTAFCLAVTIVSFIAITRFVFKSSFNITDFRDISLVSHIRYSFQVILAIFSYCFLLSIAIKNKKNVVYKTAIILLIIWLVGFLFILKSITGVIAFLGAVGFFAMYYLFSSKRKMSYLLFWVLMVLVISPVIYTKSVWDKFYNIEKLNPDQVEKYTASGNKYTFNFNSSEKENGNWVYSYVCMTELRTEWNKRSEHDFDTRDNNGYYYKSTLIRYLTSKGLKKDSVGVSKLTERDIQAIEQGIANHIYLDNRFSLYPRIYETIWEYDRYKETGNPNGQSLSQRIEFVRASIEIIKANFWIGIGTGNWKTAYANAYEKLGSQLKEENQRSSHNQYLNYMVKFGIIGFIVIICMILIPVFKEGHQKNLLFWLFLVFMGIANLGDANFETHVGLSFFCLFYGLFLWHSPESIKKFTFQQKQQ
ncbi:O-antigen ligase family protein [uncultured Draconibacterium sp.]|uniref:O-antigen ligase family protein n=1 Tax=uncultured Draconibacterium sp. TaxID=1573823 RepID=UPI002AA72E7C|nr:O-antigen ligase family protein [uncultured Draconibacterium sp.]